MEPITYTLECHPEDIPIEGNASAIDPETDAETVRWIRDQLESGNEWAWCWVKVTAWVDVDGERFTGIATLGGCAYESEDSFKDPSGYYPQLCADAKADLLSSMRSAVKRGELAASALRGVQ